MGIAIELIIGTCWVILTAFVAPGQGTSWGPYLNNHLQE